ncbi:hypothetical protein KBD08_01055 [Candidatus Babeliales bacterium]|nr:hypothetical protein [Candidatus Babeliales bacterium]
MNAIIITIILCFWFVPSHTSYSAQPSPTLADTMFISAATTLNNHTAVSNLIKTVNTYPLLGIMPNQLKVHQGIQTRAIKAMPPLKTIPVIRNAGLSILKPSKNAFKNYPAGAALFSKYPDLASLFDAMLATCKQDPKLVTFFRKVHSNVLIELYHYLMGVYINFNLQHPGIAQNSHTKELSVSVPAFLRSEQDYDMNSKTMIINHLMAIIESQFNSHIRACTTHTLYDKVQQQTRVTSLPQMFATFIGKTAVQNDYSMDLSILMEPQKKPQLVQLKKTYLTAIVDYLNFFQKYTAYMQTPHPKKPQFFTAFVDIAETINQYLYSDVAPTDDKFIASLTKMNPPLFYFGYDDMRALQTIPYIAQTIPATTKSVPWPAHIVQAAQQQLVLVGNKPHPIAYFKNNLGQVIRNFENNPSAHLYICMRLGENLFEEKVIAQPDWLNSWDGIAKIMRACFGDFSALIGMQILDPCLEHLINIIVQTQHGADPNSIAISPECLQQLQKWRLFATQGFVDQVAPSTSEIPTIPTSMTSSSILATPTLLTQP